MPVTRAQARTFAAVALQLDPEVHSRIQQLTQEYRSNLLLDDIALVNEIRDEIEKIVQTPQSLQQPATHTKVSDILLDLRTEAVMSNDISLLEHRKAVGRRIANRRNELGLKQAEVVRMSGIPQPHLSKIENGHFCATYKTIAAIALALKVRASELDPTFMTFGERVTSVCRRKGIKLPELSELVGESQSAVRKLLKDKMFFVDPETVARFAMALHVRRAELDPAIDLRNEQEHA